MAPPLSKTDFLTDLHSHIRQHSALIPARFQPLDPALLNRKPSRREWSILQCFDHLNLTHEYYLTRINRALEKPVKADPARDVYAPSFWGRIYMVFAFNPRNSFPTAASITPSSDLSKDTLAIFLARQDGLRRLIGQRVRGVDLRRTMVPLEKGVRFNLGDCLKVLVYHDALHIDQAARVLHSLKEQ